MNNWTVIAHQIVNGVGVRPGELIYLRDDTGRVDVVEEILLAIEQQGATPWLEWHRTGYMERLWNEVSPERLAQWHNQRQKILATADRIISLGSAHPNFEQVSREGFAAWQTAEQALTEIEESRQLPYLFVAIPTAEKAAELGLSLVDLEAHLLPALAVPTDQLRLPIERILRYANNAHTLTIRTGAEQQYILTLRLAAGRPWHNDDGIIDDEDRANGAIVSNLPAGSIYTTVQEEATTGQVWLAQAGQAREVLLTFGEDGRVAKITAAHGQVWLEGLFKRHTGEHGRVGHIGLGLNPHLHQPIGWTLVDEHVQGYLFLSLGENRYMGGQNESSLNIDFTLAEATLLADEQPLVEHGRVLLPPRQDLTQAQFTEQ